MFTLNERVSYSETACDGKISVVGIVNHMQNLSSYEYYARGASFDELKEDGQVWLLNSWQVVFERRPKVYENIKMSTWAYDYKDVFGYRNYLMEDEDGEKLAYANTVWVMVDSKTGRPVKATERAKAGYAKEEKLDMKYADRKIKMPKDMKKVDTLVIKKSQLDTHMHVNNVKYIEMAMEYMPEDFELRQLRVQYVKSAICGDNVIVKCLMVEDKFYISLDGEDNRPFATLELS